VTDRERELAGPAVHYAFGAAVGGAYGLLAELAPATAGGGGLPFGTAVWLAADEAALPALGLSPPPTEYPLSSHAHSLASHWIYGVTTDLVRRLVRCIL
jgi:putative membrane protein